MGSRPKTSGGNCGDGMKLNFHRWTYIILCMLACVMPLALLLVQRSSDFSSSVGDTLLGAIGNLAISVLTYPAGLVGTIAFSALIYAGVATPSEAVLCAAPLYIGAGYLQWYVLVPRHFRS